MLRSSADRSSLAVDDPQGTLAELNARLKASEHREIMSELKGAQLTSESNELSIRFEFDNEQSLYELESDCRVGQDD